MISFLCMCVFSSCKKTKKKAQDFTLLSYHIFTQQGVNLFCRRRRTQNKKRQNYRKLAEMKSKDNGVRKIQCLSYEFTIWCCLPVGVVLLFCGTVIPVFFDLSPLHFILLSFHTVLVFPLPLFSCFGRLFFWQRSLIPPGIGIEPYLLVVAQNIRCSC